MHNANSLFRLDVWDPENLSAAVDGVVAHEELINSITGSIEGGRVATGSRDGRVGLHLFHLKELFNMNVASDTSVGQEKIGSKRGKY